jgi:hypothetical protein
MQTLHHDTTARRVSSAVNATDRYIVLPEGTRYWTVSLSFDPAGYTVKRILVKGEQYDIIG